MEQAPGPDLVGEAQAGDEAAFEALLRPLMEPACRLASGMLHDHHAAEDAVQEAAVKAWKKLGDLRGADMRPWFFGIVANQCRTRRRERWWTVLKQAVPARPQESQDDRVVQGADLRRAMRRLDGAHRLVLVLYFYLDLPLQDIATITGASAAAVKGRLYRAIHRLKPHLEVPEVPV
jgi:RNA polymerase sigma-70 factor (ECF subfamily)